MTIAQKLSDKKTQKQQEKPLVPKEESAKECRPVVVTMHDHARHVNSLTTLCMFATALVVLTTGIIGGIYLYRHFAHYKLRHFRGWCSIPYAPDVQDETTKLPLSLSLVQSRPNEVEAMMSPKVNFFEEEFDIDVKYEQYEKIDVPRFERGKHAQFVHDFIINKTGIVDYERRRCFVMTLNRNFVYTPRLLYEKISKMRAGYYDIDTSTVRHTFRVNMPPISDMRNVGLFIARDCAQMPTYMLEQILSPVHKRSLHSNDREVFIEYAGYKVNEYKIINLEIAVGAEQESIP